MAENDHTSILTGTQDTSQNPNLFRIGQRVYVKDHRLQIAGGIVDAIDDDVIGIVVPLTGERYGFRPSELKAVK